MVEEISTRNIFKIGLSDFGKEYLRSKFDTSELVSMGVRPTGLICMWRYLDGRGVYMERLDFGMELRSAVRSAQQLELPGVLVK